MRTGFADIIWCSSFIKKNAAVYDVLIYSNFFCEQQIYWTIPHFLCMDRPFFLLFSSAHVIDREQQSGYFIILAL